jgi:hypothetical protein
MGITLELGVRSNYSEVELFKISRDKKINILTLVLSEKKILNETKNHNPPPPSPASS